jgi:SAM-dependent methyltransferase
MDRAQQLLKSLTKDARIVEIGPSFSPLAPKRDGWNTAVVDHAPRSELIKKYRDQAVDRIEEVDFVWTGGSIAEAIPVERHGTFDAFIASHVIEHTTDIVTFLRAAETLLRPDGTVILAVPDKRKCFDFYRPITGTADAIAAFLEKRDRHGVRTHIDYALNMALKDGSEGAWSGNDTRPAVPLNPLTDVAQWLTAGRTVDYTDAHAWVFVPSSFMLMVLELSLLGYIDLRVDDIHERDTTEFFVWLRKGSPRLSRDATRERRTALMQRVIVELADQVHQLPENVVFREAAAGDLRDQLLKATYRTDAFRTVLAALRASIGRFGLDRAKFKNLIAAASQKIPGNLSAAIQHTILLTEATKVLDGVTDPDGGPDDRAPDVVDSAVLVVPIGAAQFGDPLLADELQRERHRLQAVHMVLDAVLASLRRRALDKKRFRALVTKAAAQTPNDGPGAVRHTVLSEESRRVLGLPVG